MAILSKIYLFALLVVGILATPPPYSILAAVLLVAVIVNIFTKSAGRKALTFSLACLFFTPLIIVASLHAMDFGWVWPAWSLPFVASPLSASDSMATFLALPLLLQLGATLEAINQPGRHTDFTEGRSLTSPSRVLFGVIGAVYILSIFADSAALALVDIVLALYLLSGLVRAIFYSADRSIIDFTVQVVRIIAGESRTIGVALQSHRTPKMHVTFYPAEDWIKVRQDNLILGFLSIPLEIKITPPLSGPAMPVFDLTATDHLGLVQTNRKVQLLKLEVIPRAVYAAWLARRYLATGVAGNSEVQSQTLAAMKRGRGMEYLTSREYRPGDRLKDIDFKHSLKLGETFAKEYSQGGGTSAIILANMAVRDAEEADRLGYRLISAALTLAREGVSSALALYDNHKVLEVNGLRHADLVLRDALARVKNIAVFPGFEPRLQPADIRLLERNSALLKGADSPAANNLLSLLSFEEHTLRDQATEHPVGQAFRYLGAKVPTPAILLIVSEAQSDAEIAALVFSKVERKYDVVDLSKTQKMIKHNPYSSSPNIQI